MFLDINKIIEYIYTSVKLLEKDTRNIFLEKKKAIRLDAANLDKEQQIILRAEFERNLILELEKYMNEAVIKMEKCKQTTIKDVKQFPYS